MDFAFSPAEESLRAEVAAWLAANMTERDTWLSRDGGADLTLWQQLGEQGWLGVAAPVEYGGQGRSVLELAVVAEELGRALAPVPFLPAVLLTAEALLCFGSEAQKRKYLPDLLRGRSIGTLAYFEQGQLAPEQTSAEFEAGILNGQKSPVLDGDNAGFAVVLVRERAGLSLVLVDLDQPGVTGRALRSLDLLHGQAEFGFHNAVAERLGAAGSGLEMMQQLFDRAAVGLAFMQLGGAERALTVSTEYAKTRHQFGSPIGSFQATKHKLADMYSKQELARGNCYYGLWTLAESDPALPEAACMARISASEAYLFNGQEAVQVHGGVGFTWGAEPHLHLRASKLTSAVLGGCDLWREKLISHSPY
ncbi:MAG: acyl-CoA/acyl-ACP dehydrogenase [Gammaproteobacteria bacterium]|nr:acyl-CoA/acyl-ACP dehydrogenase [Gammaproteobacteria bacterium]